MMVIVLGYIEKRASLAITIMSITYIDESKQLHLIHLKWVQDAGSIAQSDV